MRRSLFFITVSLIIGLILSCSIKRRVPPDIYLETSSEVYPESHGIVLFDSTFIDWQRDGTGSERRHYLAKVFTTYGKNKYGEATFSYLDNYDTVVVRYANTITPEGDVIPVTEENVTNKPMPAWEGSVFLIPNLRIVKIVFPELQKGGGVEYEVEIIERTPSFDSLFDSWFLFEGEEPIMTKYLQISLPREMIPQYTVVHGELKHKEWNAGRRRIYVWEAKDVDQIISEPLMPPLQDVARKLVISTRESWQQASSWYYNMCEPMLKPDSLVKTTVEDLIEDKKCFGDTLNSLYEFVNKKIRYVETKLLGRHGGFEPQPISFTLKNKYGVCRDKAALLVGLLRAAGISESYMVLINPMMEFIEQIPALSQVNHAIVAVRKDADWIYLDPTAEYSVEWLIPIENEKPVLICTREGEGILYTPKMPPDANVMDVVAKGEIDENLELKMKMIMEGRGVMDMSLRQIFKYIPEEQFKQIVLQSMKSVHGKATIDSIISGNPEDFSTPMTIIIYMTIPEFPTVIGEEWRIGGRQMTVSTLQGNPWALQERKYPIEFQFPMRTHSESSTSFPEDMYVKLLPEPYRYEGDYIKIETSYIVKGNCITTSIEMVIKEGRIPADSYKELKEVMDEFSKLSEREIILAKK